MSNLHDRAHAALCERDPTAKCAHARALLRDWDAARLVIGAGTTVVEPVAEPGRPERPALVSPRAVERRKVSTREGRAALIHSLVHIEFNAVNLALDAVFRFRDLPRDYYSDWIRVVAEEAYHFSLLRDHLQTLGFDYGSFTAHNGLWEMAVKTAHDPLVRMALVPRLLEARGLDAAPMLIAKFDSCGDARAVEIMKIIQRDEVEHVRIGNRWYAYFCVQRGLDPVATFRQLLTEFDARLRPPFDVAARRRAGFSDVELELLGELAQASKT
ncbi:MAG: hypothetical protein A2W18_04145 [Candidatus Muproteobacteria bacterium RBG_16_60_9]|uniref:DUF455 domain-containing protein n=1 Tax=Candidatus Muproteobacteria bacterium RBG_16_60_9 TaxID=1817755 RepID=A0A1F6VJ18_9PROT|nr:MAG: hypothetical protein A2W18_04145 [Candidatus Muproteobacteria bacterium RBG_16_60_9]